VGKVQLASTSRRRSRGTGLARGKKGTCRKAGIDQHPAAYLARAGDHPKRLSGAHGSPALLHLARIETFGEGDGQIAMNVYL